ncbi:Protein kinase-like domain containing protein [Tylopilus felleus]
MLRLFVVQMHMQPPQQQPNSAGTSATNSPPPKTEIPQVSVNTPDGRTVAPTETRLTTSLDKQWCIAIQNISGDLTSQVVREDHDPIASGGFANIYRGVLQLKANRVAIKAIKTYSQEDDESFVRKEKRLRREIEVWRGLKHDNVLPLLGTTMGFGRYPAMVCPFAENGTLTSYLDRGHARLPVAEILRLVIHSRSVVHGDLSGSNILILGDGSACIADFGLSTLLTELGRPTFATSFRGRGTIQWIAPELLILSGKAPYHDYQLDPQIVLAISKGVTPRRPSNALVTEHRWAFIQQCWSTIDIARTRPSGEEIVIFTKNELALLRAS